MPNNWVPKTKVVPSTSIRGWWRRIWMVEDQLIAYSKSYKGKTAADRARRKDAIYDTSLNK